MREAKSRTNPKNEQLGVSFEFFIFYIAFNLTNSFIRCALSCARVIVSYSCFWEDSRKSGPVLPPPGNQTPRRQPSRSCVFPLIPTMRMVRRLPIIQDSVESRPTASFSRVERGDKTKSGRSFMRTWGRSARTRRLRPRKSSGARSTFSDSPTSDSRRVRGKHSQNGAAKTACSHGSSIISGRSSRMSSSPTTTQ